MSLNCSCFRSLFVRPSCSQTRPATDGKDSKHQQHQGPPRIARDSAQHLTPARPSNGSATTPPAPIAATVAASAAVLLSLTTARGRGQTCTTPTLLRSALVCLRSSTLMQDVSEAAKNFS